MFFGFRKSSFGEHKVVTKDSSIPEKPTHHPTHRITCCYQGNMQLKHSTTCDSRARWKPAITYDFHARLPWIQKIVASCYYLLYHLAKLLQKIVASQKNQHITCCYYLLYHLAKLLQKIVASQKNQHIPEHIASHACVLYCKPILQQLYARRRRSGDSQTKIFENLKTFRTVVLSTFQGCES